MAKKFEIIENSLVVTDTISGAILLDAPKSDVYHDVDALEKNSKVKIYDTSGVNPRSSGLATYDLSETTDSGGTPFTEATFLAFSRANLGFNTASGGSEANNGFADYNDGLTAITPIVLTANVWTDVTNDKLGAFTNETYLPTGVNTLMDGLTGYLDFSDLNLGSDILIRIDFAVTPNTNNSLLETRYVLGQGGGEYTLPVRSSRLDSGSGIPYSSEKGSFYIYMGDTNTLGGVGKLQVKLSTNGTLVNNGVAIKILKK